MPSAGIKSIDLSPQKPQAADAEARMRVALEDGSASSFAAATFNRPSRWLAQNKEGFHFGQPALFVREASYEILGKAAEQMASEKGGFWLRYYNASDSVKAEKTTKSPATVSSAALDRREETAPRRASAVAEVTLQDGRLFSILAATPLWFESRARELALDYYFGPSILFLREMTPALARRAAEAMAAAGAETLCRYDTPRTTLPQVLADFKSSHP